MTALSYKLSPRQGFCYGLMGFPLAFIALPLYVFLPHYYSSNFSIPLTWLGTLLLFTRIFDAAIDPVLGRWVDLLINKSNSYALKSTVLISVILSLSFALLFHPIGRTRIELILWVSVFLCATYTSFSALTLIYQSWGARLGGSPFIRGQIVAWREGVGLFGLLVASIAPVLWGINIGIVIFIVTLGLAIFCLRSGIQPKQVTVVVQSIESISRTRTTKSLIQPLRAKNFQWLLIVYVVNGMASALPATLLLFFIQDAIQAPPKSEAVFLGIYFLTAALSMFIWVRLIKRWGLVKSWLSGMLLSTLIFFFSLFLNSGDIIGFAFVCALTGLCLGADLAIPAALLSLLIADNGHQDRLEGLYFGWWNFASKFNLALAAGLSFPLLALLGYQPGDQGPASIKILTWGYCLFPCLLKLLAAFFLFFFFPNNKKL